MQVAVIGASGWLGGAVAAEALRRGHEVTGHDAVVSAVTDRTTDDRSLIPKAARELLRAVPDAGVPRLLVIGGWGSLEVEPGVRAVDQPGFPLEYRNQALAQAEAFRILETEASDVDWTYLSPPPHDLVAGERTGLYRAQAGNDPVIDEHGESRITSGDLRSSARRRARGAEILTAPLHRRILTTTTGALRA